MPRTTPCFHALAISCANTLVGSTRASRDQEAWRQTYRSLEHGHARRQCNDKSAMRRFPAEARRFGSVFTTMQSQRNLADYDPDVEISRIDVLRFIDEAEVAITLFEGRSCRNPPPVFRPRSAPPPRRLREVVAPEYRGIR